MIIADPEQLMRVVNNIVTNAIKYMDKQKGQINVRIKDVGDFIQVEIEDNGKGISARIKYLYKSTERIFEMNPAKIFQLKASWDRFAAAHPKFPLFLRAGL